MKRLLMILIGILASASLYGHSARMAIFEVSEAEGHYIISIAFDIEDLYKSVITTYPEFENPETKPENEDFIKNYIEANFQLQINDKCQEVKLTSITYDKEYVRIVADIPFAGVVSSVKVFNTCLIDYNEGHLNLFKVKLYDRVRTFKLDKERVSTAFSYEVI